MVMKKNDCYDWKSISIDKYYKIKHICEDDSLQNIERDIKIVSVVEDRDEQDVWNENLADIKDSFDKLKFLEKFEMPKIRSNRYVLDGKTYVVDTDPSHMTVAQYVDWQNFIKLDFEQGIDKLLSVFAIPEGHKYNDGYDVAEVHSAFRQHMPFCTAQALLNFILAKYITSTKDTVQCLAKDMKMKKKSKKMKRLQEMMDSYGSVLSEKFLK